ncbi:thiol-disulfide oxidoreductase ResA [Planococcus lenghuensis]|uniref:Thiol-disulfide oxidoreductase n=1 Tax=Planococcus lenghuensis TaxID=2213202 RepID=A0A1Q2KZS4_9BACL|nr:thiol-disulfide oxidoreductase ResA [Planococcus lenghuensis]AQQ53656.1 thiol-disulfide oxidoreductase [Planococcus lenghuensis]
MSDKKKKRTLIRTVLLLIMVSAIGYTIFSSATAEKNVLRVGDKAPEFALTDLDGNEHRLSEYRGEGVFLNFWGTWCKPCAREMPAINSQYEVFKDQGVNVLAVNIDQSEFEVQSYADRYGMTFPVAIDESKSVMEAYSVVPLPTTVLINSEGIVTDIITREMTEEEIAGFMESIKPE